MHLQGRMAEFRPCQFRMKCWKIRFGQQQWIQMALENPYHHEGTDSYFAHMKDQ